MVIENLKFNKIENCIEKNLTDTGALLLRSVKTLSITVSILVLYSYPSRQTSDGYYRNLCNYTKSLIFKQVQALYWENIGPTT